MTDQVIDEVIAAPAQVPDVFEVGATIPFGVVPRRMHAWTIRRERHGEPQQAFTHEVVEVPEIGDDDVLMLVMAAGVNYNGVWAALGEPFSVLDLHSQPYHIADHHRPRLPRSCRRHASREFPESHDRGLGRGRGRTH